MDLAGYEPAASVAKSEAVAEVEYDYTGLEFATDYNGSNGFCLGVVQRKFNKTYQVKLGDRTVTVADADVKEWLGQTTNLTYAFLQKNGYSQFTIPVAISSTICTYYLPVCPPQKVVGGSPLGYVYCCKFVPEIFDGKLCFKLPFTPTRINLVQAPPNKSMSSNVDTFRDLFAIPTAKGLNSNVSVSIGVSGILVQQTANFPRCGVTTLGEGFDAFVKSVVAKPVAEAVCVDDGAEIGDAVGKRNPKRNPPGKPSSEEPFDTLGLFCKAAAKYAEMELLGEKRQKIPQHDDPTSAAISTIRLHLQQAQARQLLKECDLEGIPLGDVATIIQGQNGTFHGSSLELTLSGVRAMGRQKTSAKLSAQLDEIRLELTKVKLNVGSFAYVALVQLMREITELKTLGDAILRER